MTETIITVVGSDSRVTVERNAHQRERSVPKRTIVKWIESYGDALRVLRNLGRSPAVIIRENGHAIIFGCGGSGLILVCCSNGQPSEDQQEMVDLFLTALVRLGAAHETTDPLPYIE